MINQYFHRHSVVTASLSTGNGSGLIRLGATYKTVEMHTFMKNGFIERLNRWFIKRGKNVIGYLSAIMINILERSEDPRKIISYI